DRQLASSLRQDYCGLTGSNQHVRPPPPLSSPSRLCRRSVGSGRRAATAPSPLRQQRAASGDTALPSSPSPLSAASAAGGGRRRRVGGGTGDAGPPYRHRRHSASFPAGLRVAIAVGILVLDRREERRARAGDGANEQHRGERGQELSFFLCSSLLFFLFSEGL
ncbi:Os02g0581600, partial [Oryza sativa Japonica Group]